MLYQTLLLLNLVVMQPDRLLVVQPALITPGEQRQAPALELGVLADVPVKEMQLVERGQVLANLDPRDATLHLQLAEATVAAAERKALAEIKIQHAQKELELAEAELRSIAESNIRYRNSKPPIEVERKQLEVEKSRLGIAQAKHDLQSFGDELKVAQSELAIAKRKLQRHTIVSPIAGIVASISRRGGEWVEPGQTVLRIVPIDALYAEGFVDSRDISQRDLDAPTVFQPDRPGAKPVSGKLIYVDTSINPADGLVRIKAVLDNRLRTILPGERGKLTLRLPATP